MYSSVPRTPSVDIWAEEVYFDDDISLRDGATDDGGDEQHQQLRADRLDVVRFGLRGRWEM